MRLYKEERFIVINRSFKTKKKQAGKNQPVL